MAKVWCGWESAEFDRADFEEYPGGQLLLHKGVKYPHTTNGVAVGPGPAPNAAGPGELHIEAGGPTVWDEVAYGAGPMAKPENNG